MAKSGACCIGRAICSHDNLRGKCGHPGRGVPTCIIRESRDTRPRVSVTRADHSRASIPGGMSLPVSYGKEGAPVPGCPLRMRIIPENPFLGIVFDVLPNTVVILLIADHMIIITGLPDVFTVFLVAEAFEGTDKTGNYRCSCRDILPGMFVPAGKGDQKMNVVGHDHVLVYRQVAVEGI